MYLMLKREECWNILRASRVKKRREKKRKHIKTKRMNANHYVYLKMGDLSKHTWMTPLQPKQVNISAANVELIRSNRLYCCHSPTYITQIHSSDTHMIYSIEFNWESHFKWKATNLYFNLICCFYDFIELEKINFFAVLKQSV